MSTLHFYWTFEVFGWLGWVLLVGIWSFFFFRRWNRDSCGGYQNKGGEWFLLGLILAIAELLLLVALGDAFFSGTAR